MWRICCFGGYCHIDSSIVWKEPILFYFFRIFYSFYILTGWFVGFLPEEKIRGKGFQQVTSGAWWNSWQVRQCYFQRFFCFYSAQSVPWIRYLSPGNNLFWKGIYFFDSILAVVIILLVLSLSLFSFSFISEKKKR